MRGELAGLEKMSSTKLRRYKYEPCAPEEEDEEEEEV
jgi:hypothetical protein